MGQHAGSPMISTAHESAPPECGMDFAVNMVEMLLSGRLQSFPRELVVPTGYMEISMNNRLQLALPAFRQPTVALALLLVIGGVVAATNSTFWKAGDEPLLTEETGGRSVAWYAANIREARDINRACFGSATSAERPSEEDCQNSLRALNISHVSQNYQN